MTTKQYNPFNLRENAVAAAALEILLEAGVTNAIDKSPQIDQGAKSKKDAENQDKADSVEKNLGKEKSSVEIAPEIQTDAPGDSQQNVAPGGA